MHISLFLAKFFAVYLFVLSLVMLTDADSFRTRIQALADNPGTLLLGSMIALILGIILILLHSLWLNDWRMVVTLLAWLTFAKGILSLFCPKLRQRMIAYMNNPRAYRICGVFCLLLAGFLGYHGFGF